MFIVERPFKYKNNLEKKVGKNYHINKYFELILLLYKYD